MVDVILQAVECDGPKLKDCLPAIGALKHLREWHSAQITIAASDAKGYGICFRAKTKSLLLCVSIDQWVVIKTACWVLYMYTLKILKLIVCSCMREGITHSDSLYMHVLTRQAGKKASPLHFLFSVGAKSKILFPFHGFSVHTMFSRCIM